MPSMPRRQNEAVALLQLADDGDPDALDRLVPYLYNELRTMARRQLRREREHVTLHTTELVHEAFLRLADCDAVSRRGRAYFFGATARAMRRVLVDAARRRTADKRGGDATHVTLGDDTAADEAVTTYAGEVLDLHEALSALEQQQPRLARVVELRYFGGLDVNETADALEVSPRTVKSDWALARAWLRNHMSDA